jgi:hypothetical protein
VRALVRTVSRGHSGSGGVCSWLPARVKGRTCGRRCRAADKLSARECKSLLGGKGVTGWWRHVARDLGAFFVRRGHPKLRRKDMTGF